MLQKIKDVDKVNVVRCLLLAELFFLLFSTSLTVVVELLVFVCFIVFADLRGRLVKSVKANPVALMALCWLLVLCLASLYSVGPREEVFDTLKSWRKILLLPLAVAVFNDIKWKERFAWTLIISVTICMLLAYASWMFKLQIYKFPPGIIIYNHASQGVLFAVTAYTSLVMLRWNGLLSNVVRWALGLITLLLVVHLVFITPGRSGYLALLVLSVAFCFFATRGWLRVGLALGVPVALVGVMLLSPTASGRVTQAVSEMQNYAKSEKLTAMGVRVIMWQNTIKAIKERPLLGYGTGGFSEAYSRQVVGVEGWRGDVVGDPHNQFMRVVAEQGIVGLLVFCVFIASFFRQQVTGWPRVAAIGVLLSWMATSMFSAHFSTFMEGRFLYLFCGVLLAVGWKDNEVASGKNI